MKFIGLLKWMQITILSITLIACGGGSGKSGSITGTVATGAPLSGGVITIVDSKNKTMTTTTDSSGKYSVDINSLTPPLVIYYSGFSNTGNNITLYSIYDGNSSNNTVNITPLSDAIITLITGQTGSDFLANPDFSKLNASSIATANTSIANNLSSLLQATNLPSTVNFINTNFDANKTGIDLILDLIQANTMPAKSTVLAPSILLAGKLSQGSLELTPPVGGVANGSVVLNGAISATTIPAGVNLSAIDNLIAKINTNLQNPSSYVANMVALSDPNFMELGNDALTFWAQSTSYQTLSKSTINGCNFSTPFICNVSFLIGQVNSTQNPIVFQIQVVANNGAWLFYGNQQKIYTSLHTGYYNLTDFTSDTTSSSQYAAFETNISSEGTYGPSANSANLYISTSQGWFLVGSLTKALNSFGTPGTNSFIYSELQLSDSDIDMLYNESILLGSLQARLDVLDVNNLIIQSTITYNISLPMKQSQLSNMNYIGLSSSGLAQLKNYNGQNHLSLNLDAMGGGFSSIGINENWTQTKNMALTQTTANLGAMPTSIDIGFSNSITLGADKFRAIDIFGNDAQGRYQHVKYLGCNASNCTSN